MAKIYFKVEKRVKTKVKTTSKTKVSVRRH